MPNVSTGFKGDSLIPRVLISVRSHDEAIIAAQNGADILDVKDPVQGPLGRPDPQVVDDIRTALTEANCCLPLSIALGELTEWFGKSPAASNESQPGPPSHVQQEIANRLFEGTPPVTFAKLGLSNTADSSPNGHGSSDSGWTVRLRELINYLRDTAVSSSDSTRFRRRHLHSQRAVVPRGTTPTSEIRSIAVPQWVAVVYADHQLAACPEPETAARLAVNAGCTGLLIDTFQKDGTGLLHHLSLESLKRIRAVTREFELWLAVAGQLSIRDLDPLREAEPDIIGVRGAVCCNSDRSRNMQPELIRDFVDAVRDCFETQLNR